MRIVFLTILTALLTACGGSDSDSESAQINIPFNSLGSTQNSSVTVTEGVVAKNQAEFDALLIRYFGAAAPSAPFPTVDFNNFQVLGVFLGLRPNGCYSVAITRITQTNNGVLVSYKEQGPSPTSVCTLATVNPAQIVTMAKSQLPVQFVAD